MYKHAYTYIYIYIHIYIYIYIYRHDYVLAGCENSSNNFVFFGFCRCATHNTDTGILLIFDLILESLGGQKIGKLKTSLRSFPDQQMFAG